MTTDTQMAPAELGESIITIDGLNKWYGQFHVLKDIDLDVKRGERIVICGPSGSGKSTLIRCINRLETHQEGSIVVDGIELTDDTKHINDIRREVGMVFQHFNLFPHLTVLENCTLAPIWVRKTPKREAEELAMQYLERVKIPEQANKYAGQLSGGQQQRLCIARAVATQPEVLLMDEPCSALDPIATAQVEELIDELRSNFSVVIVTHSMQQAARVSQKTAFFHLGNLVEYGETGQIFTNPVDPRTESYISGRIG